VRKSTRKLVATVGLVLGLCAYAWLASALILSLGALHVLVELLAYALAGVAWILPCKPLLFWVETGRWREVRDEAG
jgi:Protein of unknown function (DUF2842)